MKKYILAIFLALLLLLSLITPALATSTVAVNAFWTANDNNSLTIDMGETATARVALTSPTQFYYQYRLLDINSGEILLPDVTSPLNPATSTPRVLYLDVPADLPVPMDVHGDYRVRIKAWNALDASDYVIKNLELHVRGNRAPVITVHAEQTISEGDYLTFDVSGADVDSDRLVLVATNGMPSGASLVTQTNVDGSIVKKFRWTPNFEQAGTYDVTFRVNDGHLADSGIVRINVEENNAPTITLIDEDDAVISASELNVNEGDSLQIQVIGTDIDADTLELSAYRKVVGRMGFSYYSELPSTTFPELNFNSESGILTFSPGFDYVKHTKTQETFRLKFQTSDGDKTAVKELFIRVNDVNRLPVATSQTVSTNEETAKSIVLAGTDADTEDATRLKFIEVSTPAHGSLTGTAPNLVYTPVLDFVGTDTFTFKVEDRMDGVSTTTATVTINVVNVNDAPVANDEGIFTTSEDSSRNFALVELTRNDVDVDSGDTLTITGTTSSVNGGTATISGAFLTYTPAANYNGNDQFTYTVSDGHGATDTATVRMTVTPVNDAPVAGDDSYELDEGNSLTIIAPGVLGNDYDVDGNTLQSIFGTGTHRTSNGDLVLNIDGSFTYTPYDINFNGTDSFTYSINDGVGGSDIATVSITVESENDVPVLSDLVTQIFDEDTGPHTYVLTGKATDADTSDRLIYGVVAEDTSKVNCEVAGGSLEMMPAPNYNGVISCTIRVTDLAGAYAEKVIRIEVNAVNDAPIVTDILGQTVAEGSSFTTINLNDYVTDLETADNAILWTASGYSELTVSITSNVATITIPSLDWNGAETITFIAQDLGDGISVPLSDSDNAIFTVTGVNDIPVIEDFTPESPVNMQETDSQLFTVTVSDVDTPITNLVYTWTLDGILQPDTGLSFTYTSNYDDEREHTLVFQVSDEGMRTDSQEWEINVDNTNRPPVLDAIGDRTVAENTLLDFTLTATDEDNDDFTFSATGLPTGAELNEDTGVFAWTPDFTQAETYSVIFTVTDENGGTDSETITITVTDVNRAPVFTVDTTQEAVEGETVSFTVTAIDPDDGNTAVVSTEDFQDSTFNPITGEFSWTTDFNDAGTYHIIFTAVDNNDATLTSTVDVTIVVIDNPSYLVIDSFSPPNPVSMVEMESEDFTVIAHNDGSSDLIYTWALDGTLRADTDASFIYNTDYTSAGEHTLIVTINDGSASVSKRWDIDVENANRPPVLAPIGNQEVDENEKLSFTLTATDEDNDDFTFSATGLPTGAELDEDTGEFTWTPDFTQAGVYTVILTVTDENDGTDSETITITIENVNRAPVFTVDTTQEAIEGETVRFTVTAIDPDDGNAAVVSTEDFQDSTFNPITGEFSWTTDFNDAETYTIRFTAIDNNDATVTPTVDVTIIVTDNPQSPVIEDFTPESPVEMQETETETFTVIVSDADTLPANLIYTWTLDGISQPDTGLSFTYASNYDDEREHTLVFQVSDEGMRTDSQEWEINVENTNRLPELDAIGNKPVAENDLLSFTLIATDADNDDLTFSATGLPTGAELNEDTGVFAWTPDFTQAETYSVIFTVTDENGGTDSETITITVTDVNRAPVLDLIGPQSVNENVLLQFTVSATDADEDALTYSATGLPTGATFDASTRTFSWTPSYDQEGDYTVTFHVEDTLNDFDEEEVIITVGNNNRAPIFEDIEDKNVDENTLLQFTVSATDSDGDDLTYSTSDLPTGAAFDVTTKTFTWTPTYDQSGSYEVTFQVSDGENNDEERITITVGNSNRAPTANNDDTYTVLEETTLTVDAPGVLANDVDSDGTGLTASLVSNTLHGTLTLSADGSFTYRPTANFFGTDSFTYNAYDGTSYSTTPATVTISVTNVNDLPTITSTAPTTAIVDELYSYQVIASDDNTLQYSLGAHPEGMTISNTGLVQWTPSEAGNFNVVIVVSDGVSLDSFAKQSYTISVERLKEELKIMSFRLDSEEVFAGDVLSLHLQMENKGNKDAKDLQLVVDMPELGVRKTTSRFNLADGRSEKGVLRLPLPYDTPAGDYLLKVTLKNSKVHETAYRYVTVLQR